MCKANDKNGRELNNERYNGVADIAGRVLEPEYTRNPCYCERCQMRKVQVFGRWCFGCFDYLEKESRIDWVEMPRTLFEVYAREDANAPAR